MSHLDPNIIVALITGLFGLAGGVIVAIITSRSTERQLQIKEDAASKVAEKKDAAQQELISYKIDQLTTKVEKHNQVVERVALLEHDMKTVWMRYDDLKKEMKK